VVAGRGYSDGSGSGGGNSSSGGGGGGVSFCSMRIK